MDGALDAWEGAVWGGATPRDTALSTGAASLIDAMASGSDPAAAAAAKGGDWEERTLPARALVERQRYLRRVRGLTLRAVAALSLALPLLVMAYSAMALLGWI